MQHLCFRPQVKYASLSRSGNCFYLVSALLQFLFSTKVFCSALRHFSCKKVGVKYACSNGLTCKQKCGLSIFASSQLLRANSFYVC